MWSQFNTISNAIGTLRSQLPPIEDPRGLQPLETVGRANPELAHSHIELLAAAILLSNAVRDVPELGGAEGALEAASRMAGLVKKIRGDGPLAPIHAPISLLVSQAIVDMVTDTI